MTKLTINDLRKEIVANQRAIADLNEEIAAATGLNARLNQTIKGLREKIGSLKQVSRFFRAQRDRVDAYLSAVLDMTGSPKTDASLKHSDDQVILAPTGEWAVKKDAPSSNRPRINEPTVKHSDGEMGDGRNFAPYRDNEPSLSWEDF